MKTILTLAILHFALFGMANNGEKENVSIEVNTTDEKGRKQGKWIIFGRDEPQKGYPNDGKIYEGYYKDDRKNGKWTVYYKDGITPKLIGEYKNNRPNGKFQKFYPNGELKEEGTFDGQSYVDTLKRFNIHGILIYKANYNKSGKESGKVSYIYDNGNPEFIYFAFNGTPNGRATRFWSNGEVKEDILFDENGSISESTGIIDSTKPIPSTKIKSLKEAPLASEENKGFYKQNGYNSIYDTKDNLWMEGHFKDGKLWNGRLLIYDKDGLLLKIEVYKNGVYHSDGHL